MRPGPEHFHLIDYGELADIIVCAYPEPGAYVPQSLVDAYLVGKSPALLRYRLKEAVPLLHKPFKGKFKNAKFSFEEKRLYGQGFYLEWSLRHDPALPHSYENQQTSRGSVSLYRVK